MSFNQTYQNVGSVYNVNGDLILSSASTRDDLADQLQRIKRELNKLPDLSSTTRDEVSATLDKAARESKSPATSKSSIVDQINTAGTLLKKSSGMAENAVKLAETLFKIATWVGAIL
jgi:hypothetical protein